MHRILFISLANYLLDIFKVVVSFYNRLFVHYSVIIFSPPSLVFWQPANNHLTEDMFNHFFYI